MKNVVLSAVLAIAAATYVSTQQPRELVQNQSPIVSRIVPGDRVVIVRRPEAGLEGSRNLYTSAEFELLGLVDLEELYVVRQITTESRFIGNGNWIRSRVRGTIERVLKTRRRAAAGGTALEFEIDGGEIESSGVRIIAGAIMHFDRPSYLMGLQNRDDIGEGWRLVRLFEITSQETLAPFRRRDNGNAPPSWLFGKPLDDVAVAASTRK